jgi:hypothetical protein
MQSPSIHARGKKTIATVVLALILSSGVTASSASTSVSYDFNTAGQLTSEFNSYVSSGVFEQFSSGGIGNTGSIGPTSGASYSGNAVFASKDQYSIGPVGSSYTFTSFMRSVGNSGYSGMGFTALTPSAANSSVSVAFRPNDALGISVHGGGFVFHNGSSSPQAQWNSTSPSAPVTKVKSAGISDLLNSGSPDQWYKVVLKIVRDSSTTFDMRVEVWPSNSSGVLLRPSEADAIFELNNQEAPGLIAAPTISSYVNFSGTRVYNFDNYSVELAGGSSVISPGAPVVLSTSASTVSGVVTFIGDVTSNGGSSVTERGFVYSTNPNPTISDSKVVVGTGTGSFTGTTPALTSGTYYFRAYATNSTGTSYGASLTDSFVGITAPSPSPTPSSSPTPTETATQAPAQASAPASATTAPVLLATTGTSLMDQLWLVVTLTLLGAALVGLSRAKGKNRLEVDDSSPQMPRL